MIHELVLKGIKKALESFDELLMKLSENNYRTDWFIESEIKNRLREYILSSNWLMKLCIEESCHIFCMVSKVRGMVCTESN